MLLFPEKFLDFHPPNFLMTFFLVIDRKFRIPPISLFQYISPLFFENYYFPPTFTNFPMFSKNLHASYVFRFPPTLTMMHLCITQCTYWTPLGGIFGGPSPQVFMTSWYLLISIGQLNCEETTRMYVDLSCLGMFLFA